jgi:hypothetical protein
MTSKNRAMNTLVVLAAAVLVGATSAPANAATSTRLLPQQAAEPCTAFGTALEARNAAAKGKAAITLWTTLWGMTEAKKLYDAYLTPGKPSLERTLVTSAAALTAFRQASETNAAVQDLVDGLKDKLPSESVQFDTEYDLNEAGLGLDIPIAWENLQTTPGFIAGGLSGVEYPDTTFVPDSRTIAGKYLLTKTTRDGDTKVTLHLRDLNLRVLDSIDFCPGNLVTGLNRDVALGLSRLERTPYTDRQTCTAAAHCTYARPVLFQADVPLNNTSVDITELFPNTQT